MDWNTILRRSYTPYSNQSNACIVQSEHKRNYVGVRIENSSFPLTITAVQSAICQCLSNSENPRKLLLPDDSSAQNNEWNYWIEEFNLQVVVTTDIENLSIPNPLIDATIDPLTTLKEYLFSAVTPNSKFPVSALIETEAGYVCGVNVEIADWTRGLCAERLALAKAVAWDYKSYHCLYLLTAKGDFCSPCGACRQVLSEHMDDSEIILNHPDGTQSRHFTQQLLPFSFTVGADVLG